MNVHRAHAAAERPGTASDARLWVVIPALNEQDSLPTLLASLRRVLPGARCVVVDDASTDRTREVALAGGAVVLSHATNLGYGGALQTGYRYCLARGLTALLQLDADGQHDPDTLPGLLAASRESGADVLLGSRFLDGGSYPMSWPRRVGRRLFARVARSRGLAVTDPTSGLQVLSPAAVALYTGDFFPENYPDLDVLLVAHQHGLRIAEHPVHMHEARRPSRLHGGFSSVFYLYRLGLSLWAGLRRSG